jgi:hypothetical protein
MIVGSTLTAPATIAINVVDAESLLTSDSAVGQMTKNGGRVNNTAVNLPDIEEGGTSNEGPNRHQNKKLSGPIEIEMVDAEDMSRSPPKSSGTPFLKSLLNRTSKRSSINDDDDDEGDIDYD